MLITPITEKNLATPKNRLLYFVFKPFFCRIRYIALMKFNNFSKGLKWVVFGELFQAG